MREANVQKELLLHDINHRIKNHLQSVMAMLLISRRRITDRAAGEAVDETMNRLSVLARVYDRLELKPGGEAAVSARDFIEGLCADLRPILFDLRPIALTIDVEPVSVELERAALLGLIVNEALTNALKYAFPEERAGAVSIRLLKEEDSFRLDIEDDGVGLDGEAQAGTGAKLIRALAGQLRGELEWGGPPGTRIALRFPARAGI